MRYRYQSGGNLQEIVLERQGESFRAIVAGVEYRVEVLSNEPGELSLLFDGKPMRLYWATSGDQKWVSLDGCTYLLEKPAPTPARRSGEASAGDSLRAPMPAQVRAVQVSEGDTVEQGQTLLILEAMKMEIRLSASRSGKVARLLVQVGQIVQRDQMLVEIA